MVTGNASSSKRAVTDASRYAPGSEQLCPEQSPLKPSNSDPGAGCAVSTSGPTPDHCVAQLAPCETLHRNVVAWLPIVFRIDPLPAPVPVTVTFATSRPSDTVWSPSIVTVQTGPRTGPLSQPVHVGTSGTDHADVRSTTAPRPYLNVHTAFWPQLDWPFRSAGLSVAPARYGCVSIVSVKSTVGTGPIDAADAVPVSTS